MFSPTPFNLPPLSTPQSQRQCEGGLTPLLSFNLGPGFCPLFRGPSDCSLKQSPEKTWERVRYTPGSPRRVGIWPRPPWERLQGRCSLTVSGLKAHPCLGFCCNSLLEPSRVQMSHPKVQRGTGFWALRAVGSPDPGPGPGGVSEMLPFLITPSVASLAFPACPKVGSGGGAPPGELASCSVGLIPSWRLLLQSGYLRNDASRPWEVRSQNQVTQLARDRVWAE